MALPDQPLLQQGCLWSASSAAACADLRPDANSVRRLDRRAPQFEALLRDHHFWLFGPAVVETQQSSVESDLYIGLRILSATDWVSLAYAMFVGDVMLEADTHATHSCGQDCIRLLSGLQQTCLK